MRTFEGRVAVVTGAASGMGRAFAERFAQAGMRVVLADVEEHALAATVQTLRQQEYDVLGVMTDVADPQAVEELAHKTLEAYGNVHVVCNNAGVATEHEVQQLLGGVTRPLWEEPLQDWQWTFAVNFWGVVHGIRTFVPLLLQHGEEGHIVNTASTAGLTSGAALPIYGASKHAVVRISEALHLQLAQRQAPVKVSVLCPGGVRTRIALAERNRPETGLEETAQSAREQAWATLIGERGLEPEAVAEQVFQAIAGERFYILTHPEVDRAIQTRFENLLARRNP